MFEALFRMEKDHSIKPTIIVFDVYETLLDMREIERKVNYAMDSVMGYRIWFELFMQYCFVDNCTGNFNDFSSIAGATMKMAGKSLGQSVTDDQVNDILERLKHVPVHENVAEYLSVLNDEGYRIAALTNSPKKIILERMEQSGLISYFEQVLSAEEVKKYKPCSEVYQWASKKLNTPVDQILIVSSHGWDIAGAASVGIHTAYIQQPRQMLYSLAPAPDLVCKDFADLANQLGIMIRL